MAFGPQKVISKLDVKLRTHTACRLPSADIEPWVSQTPHNPADAPLQTKLVRNRIARHQDSSPTPIFTTVTALAKGTEILAHEVTLLTAENRTFVRQMRHLVNAAGLKRHMYVKEVHILSRKHMISWHKRRSSRLNAISVLRSVVGTRNNQLHVAVALCGMTGHNARTCQEDVER